MKVQLIVVQGKPEGKTIPLLVPRFKIGRGETCHLRPSSEQVSREHAEFVVSADRVTVTDLGSRNGTLVNGRALTAPHTLKNGDLVQVGPLTFAVSIEGAPQPRAAEPKPAPAAAKAVGSLDDVSNDEIDAWLVSDKQTPAPESPSGVYSGDTITITAFKDATSPQPAAPAKPDAPEDSDEGYERLEDEDELGDDEGEGDDEEGSGDDMPEDFIDESNPFYVKKKKPEEAAPGGGGKLPMRDTSDAASEILRKMMERKKQQKS